MTYALHRVLLSMILIAALLFPSAARAQSDNPIRAQVDRTNVSTDDILTLSVIVELGGINGTVPQVIPPVLDGFDLLSTSTATQMSIINGAMSAVMVHTYQLRPTRADTLTIPPFSIDINGQTYTTDPITVQVTPGVGGQPQQAQPSTPASSATTDDRLRVEAVVDNSTPYVGEQVSYSFRFLQQVMLFTQPEYMPPDFTGFWNIPNEQEASFIDNGYRVTELTTYLFPTTPGEATIAPARLIIPGAPMIELATEPVTVNVRPLPDGAPASFNGAVGQYDIVASASTSAITNQNESVTLRVTVSGVGNVDALPDLVWPDMPGWRVFDSDIVTQSAIQGGLVVGTRTYERVLVPTEEGDLTIPAIEFTFFDPEAEQYVTESTAPILVSVAPGAAEVAQAPQPDTPAVATTQPTQPDPAPQTAVVRPVKPVPDALTNAVPPLTSQPLFWLLWAVPAAMLLVDVLLERRARYLAAHEKAVRSSQAHKRAKQELRRARQQASDAYGAAWRIFNGYLSDKIQQPVVGLTRSALARLLETRGVERELVDQVEAYLLTLESSRFSPAHQAPDEHVLEETERLITELERRFA